MYFYLRRTEERSIRTQQTLFNPTKGKIHGVCKFNAYWFFTFFWLTKGFRKKNLNIYIKQRTLRTYLLRYMVIRAAMGTGRG